MPPSLSLLKVLAAEATNVVTNSLVLEGHEFVRLEIKFCCGICNEVAHYFISSVKFYFILFLFKDHSSKALGAMELKGLTYYGTPSHIVRRLAEVGALVAVSAHFLSAEHLEFGEESADKFVRHGISYFPTVFSFYDFRRKRLFLGDKSYKFMDVGTHSEKHATYRIEFYIEIAVVILIRTEEKFKAAILARNSDRSVFGGSYVLFNG
jgi:hypothetical protein